MKIAVIGAGISGLTAAYYLSDHHQVTVLERNKSVGGHTATIDVTQHKQSYQIDTGFIVFNDWTYPNFIDLLTNINVPTQATEMSFSVHCDDNGLEYAGNNLNTLFAQRRNLIRPEFLGMVRDIIRFNKEALSDLSQNRLNETETLQAYLQNKKYGKAFIEYYLVPMGCAIWSASTKVMMEFPILFFIRFFKNHGLLSVNNRPQWRVIKGGSKSYIKPLIEKFSHNIQTDVHIKEVKRLKKGVEIHLNNRDVTHYDQVIFACHSDQAHALLYDASPSETSILKAIPYQDNEVVLHTDISLLPTKKRVWSSWNYRLRERLQNHAVLTYNMNILQGIQSSETFCVTLNDTHSINPKRKLGTYHYAHPVFSQQSAQAQARWSEINGVNNTWFCGAYWGNGFHEDGVASARRVVNAIIELGNQHD